MTDRDPNAPHPNAPHPNASSRKGSSEMNPDQAMASLQDIHRMQDRTREEYIRQGGGRPYNLAMSAGVILVFSGFDVPEPWQRVVAPIGCAVIFATIFLAQRRAKVRRKTTTSEAGFTLAMAGLWFAGFLPLLIGAKLVELPAPWTIAATVCTILCGLLGGRINRAYAKSIRWF